jgi:iron complex transport system substrate-binding protein
MKKAICAAVAVLFLSAGAWSQGVSARDSLDRPVSLRAPAQRVVSLSPSATETLFGIDAGDRVVGVTDYCSWPAEAATRPKVGGYSGSSISLEKILALHPDLVVCGGSIHASIRASLERLGLAVYVYEPANVEATFKCMGDVGGLTGRIEGAGRLVAGLKHELADVAARVSAIPYASRVRVFWEVCADPLVTCGSRSLLNDFVVRAGGVNVFGDLNSAWPIVSSEEVLRRSPQVILAAEDHGPGLSAEELAHRPGWASIPAVRTGNIRLLPADPVNRAGPRMAQGVRLIARALYPELFP